MKNQKTLQKYFRVQSDRSTEMINSCNLTPNQSPKLKNKNGNIQDVIDDEDVISSTPKELNQSATSNCNSNNQATLDKYFTVKSDRSTEMNNGCNLSLKKAPNKSPKLKNENIQDVIDNEDAISSTPNERKRKRHSSPTKKESVSALTLTKLKRILSHSLSPSGSQSLQDVDYKTIFLLKLIDKFLCDENLKPLLSQSSCDLLSSASQVKKPGMTLVCTLYWQQDGFHRWEKVKQIMTAKPFEGDDSTLREALNSLIVSGFITLRNKNNAEDLDFDGLSELLRLEDLKSICTYFNIDITKAVNKREVIESLKKYCRQKKNMTNFLIQSEKISSNHDRALTLMRTKLGSFYKLSDEARKTLAELQGGPERIANLKKI